MGDSEFVANIRNNTTRYIRYFEEMADEMLPVPRVVHHERDVVDFLQNQREVANSAGPGGEQGAQLPQSDLPKSLTRRFEVNIVPPQAERPVKIREILATGENSGISKN
jgi:hypothetical protein